MNGLISLMTKTLVFLVLLCGVVFQASEANARQLICHDFSSEIEPDMQRYETDFTYESYAASQRIIETTIREWMESKFERNKKNPTSMSKLFDGEIWLAHANHDAMVKGYVLKLEYLSASAETKENSRQVFCKFLTETPYYD